MSLGSGLFIPGPDRGQIIRDARKRKHPVVDRDIGATGRKRQQVETKQILEAGNAAGRGIAVDMQ